MTDSNDSPRLDPLGRGDPGGAGRRAGRALGDADRRSPGLCGRTAPDRAIRPTSGGATSRACASRLTISPVSGRIVILRKGKPADPAQRVKGVIRLALPAD